MSASRHHCGQPRRSRVRCQYQRNSATANAEWACDQEGLKYMYTGSELAHQMANVASQAHRLPTYWRARRKERSRPRKPYKAVPKAMAMRYGSENPSAATGEPAARARSTPVWASSRKGAQRMAGPTAK